MAQLSQELAEDKDYGSLEGVAEIIRKYTTSPKVELSDFFRRVVFCFLTGNGDMHLKNWSLSQDPNTNLIKLSPVYDLLNVRMSFPQEQVESILTVDDKQNDLTRSTFFKFGKDSLELPESYVNKVLSDTKNWLKTVNIYCERSALSPERKKTYMDIVEKRYSKLQED
jgi:serine/threonine-protein kinase HipA